MPAAGFEPAIPATEPLKTHALKAERAVINFSQSSEMANWRSECKETVLPVLIKTFIYSDKSEMKLLDSLHAPVHCPCPAFHTAATKLLL